MEQNNYEGRARLHDDKTMDIFMGLIIGVLLTLFALWVMREVTCDQLYGKNIGCDYKVIVR